jgi:hypothetical protein
MVIATMVIVGLYLTNRQLPVDPMTIQRTAQRITSDATNRIVILASSRQGDTLGYGKG